MKHQVGPRLALLLALVRRALDLDRFLHQLSCRVRLAAEVSETEGDAFARGRISVVDGKNVAIGGDCLLEAAQ